MGTGFEPVINESKSFVMPFHYPTICVFINFLVLHRGIEPLSPDRKSDVIATTLMEQVCIYVSNAKQV
jgi:hypothetical protein